MDLLSSAACNVHIFPEVVQPVCSLSVFISHSERLFYLNVIIFSMIITWLFSSLGGLNNDTDRSFWMLISHFDSLRRRFVKITSKETPPHGSPHAMVRGGICPMLKDPKIADIDYQIMAKWRCKMQYKWMNGALCRNNASVSYFQNTFSGFGVSPLTSAGPPVVRRPLSLLPLRGEYPAGAQA